MKKYSTNHVRVEKETYAEVMERDMHRCTICHADYLPLHLHHINGRSREKTNDIKNCVILCYQCHRMVHDNQKKWRPILEEYIEGKYEG